MDDILARRKEVFFNNLVLLGLDRMTFEKKHGITFHKDMFVLPNKKGYEVVTHFLFSKLNSATSKDYNIPWPLLSKEHDRVFQKTCYSHLVNFSQENTIKFPRIVPSLLSTFGGDRFYEVYLAFSCYVLHKTIRKNGNISLLSRPSASRESFSTAKDISQLSTILCMKKFRDIESVTYGNQHIWLKFAKNLEKCLQKLKHVLKTNEDLLKKKRKLISSLYSTIPEENLNLKKMIERSFECLKPVIKQRKILDQFFAVEKKHWQYLSSEVGENVENEFLNGQNYNICVTENLPGEYHKELENVGYSSKENGKLSVIRFIKLFMAYLTYITDLLKKADLSELHKMCFVEDASSIEDDLNSVKSLNKKLIEEVIPDIEESIEKLKSINYFDNQKENLELSCNQFCSSLPVLSFDTESIKERVSYFDPSLERIFQLPPSERQLCSNEIGDHVFMPENNSLNDPSFMSSMNQTIATGDSSLHNNDIFSRRMTIANSCTSGVLNEKMVFSQADPSRQSEVPFMDHPLSSRLTISGLDDIDFAPSAQFIMRGSWLQEESLNAMTLPDISFDD